jgi:hypothetical protein
MISLAFLPKVRAAFIHTTDPPPRIDLKTAGKNTLTQVAEVLAGIADRRFLVAGHTDNVPIRTPRFPSNWELSTGRAVEVARRQPLKLVENREPVLVLESVFVVRARVRVRVRVGPAAIGERVSVRGQTRADPANRVPEAVHAMHTRTRTTNTGSHPTSTTSAQSQSTGFRGWL